jgi:hypothetical protein
MAKELSWQARSVRWVVRLFGTLRSDNLAFYWQDAKPMGNNLCRPCWKPNAV